MMEERLIPLFVQKLFQYLLELGIFCNGFTNELAVEIEVRMDKKKYSQKILEIWHLR